MQCLNMAPETGVNSKRRHGYREAIGFFQPRSFLAGNVSMMAHKRAEVSGS